MNNVIVWFRKDLRIHDNPALWQASQEGNVIPLFIWSPSEEEDYQESAASLWWLHHSLIALEQKLAKKKLPLIYRSGDSLEELTKIIHETGAQALFYNERYEPSIKERDKKIKTAMASLNINVHTFHSDLLFSPYDIKNKQNEPYKVFTSFYKSVLHNPVFRPIPYIETQSGVKHTISSLCIDDLQLLPKIRWDKKLHNYWKPGEDGAIKQYEKFVDEGLSFYKKRRDIPSENNVSFLSPYLTWGNISVRAIWYSLERKSFTLADMDSSLESFKRQLIWRDFAYYQLIHFPMISQKPLRSKFEKFPWLDNENDFLQWKKGLTGYPIIDAGMRELYETGVMHNRVRMIAASFLIKHLLIPWQKGYDYFSETLVDFDVANNAMGWQWVAGCGVETAPYFRIFNPILQSEKFDQDGDYIRKWIPEIAKLPSKYIHKPWEAPEEILHTAHVRLGKTYPEPMIDHMIARQRALAAFEEIKNM